VVSWEGRATYEAAAVEFDENGVISGFYVLGEDHGDFDFMVTDLLVVGCVYVEVVEAGFRCCPSCGHGAV
jgi:hypothetical protein